jgi:acetyl esterase/lipase
VSLIVELSKVAPELRQAAGKAPTLALDAGWVRGLVQALLGLMPAAKIDGVRLETHDGVWPHLRIFRPDQLRSAGALFWIHGGGYLIGRAVQDDRLCAETARALGIVVVSVSYRLGPRHPAPEPQDDCHAGWMWLQQAAASLGVDPARIVVGGQSAGGGLAACLAQRLRDEGRAVPVGQWLFCPMLDDRTAARRELDAIRHRVWNNRLNAAGWRSLLAVAPGSDVVPPYAVAARRTDLRGLPPAWIGVGDIDLFHDEDRAYAERLRQAGVDVAFDVTPGAPHAFEGWARDTALAREHVGRARAWLGKVLGVSPG